MQHCNHAIQVDQVGYQIYHCSQYIQYTANPRKNLLDFSAAQSVKFASGHPGVLARLDMDEIQHHTHNQENP